MTGGRGRTLWAVLVAVVAALAVAGPAGAQADPPPYTLTIHVMPTRAMPGDVLRVTAASPPPPVVQWYGGESGFSYDLLLTYTTAAGAKATVPKHGIAGTSLHTTMTLPADAKQGTLATLSATLGYDSASAYAGVGTDTVTIAVGPAAPTPTPAPTAAVGSLALSRVRVPAGGSFVVNGTGCRAGRYYVRYRSGTRPWVVVAEGPPEDDGTFSVRVDSAWLRTGTGRVTAECGDTAYPTLTVRVLARARAVPLLPVTGPPTGRLLAAGLGLVALGTACATFGRDTAGHTAR